MNRSLVASLLFVAGLQALPIPFSPAAQGEDFTLHTFKKYKLSDQFYCEGANFGDFNKDGKGDVVVGPYWYEGPDFSKKHEIYTPKVFQGAHGYSDNFFQFTYDFNKDGYPDVLVIDFPGQQARWYENPKGKDEHWAAHVVYDNVDNESPTFGDFLKNGKPVIVCNSHEQFGYVEPDYADPAKTWVFHPISKADKRLQRFTHGLGFGDINGDGLNDILEATGWWEQPKGWDGKAPWEFHACKFSDGGSQMYVYDVNNDGKADVVTSLQAHGYGLAWQEQVTGADGKIEFKRHKFMGEKPEENKYGVEFSEPHAVDFIDMDGDGAPDIVTGKRFWAHGPDGDKEPNAAAVLYWFKLVRNADKSVEFVPYLIDNDSGVGTQVVAGDINGDGLPDIVVGNKKGSFVFIHEAKKVSKEEWEKAQPKPLPAK